MDLHKLYSGYILRGLLHQLHWPFRWQRVLPRELWEDWFFAVDWIRQRLLLSGSKDLPQYLLLHIDFLGVGMELSLSWIHFFRIVWSDWLRGILVDNCYSEVFADCLSGLEELCSCLCEFLMLMTNRFMYALPFAFVDVVVCVPYLVYKLHVEIHFN